MENILSLEISEKSSFIDPKVPGEVLRAVYGRINENQVIVLLIENSLIGYEYDEAKKKFEFRWKKEISFSSGASGVDSFWLIDVNNNGNDNLIIREKDGLKAYQIDGENLKSLGASTLFHESYGKNQNVAIGKFFVNQKFTGVFRKDRKNAITFYVFESNCLGQPNCGFLKKLTTSLKLSEVWKAPDTKIFLTSLKKEDPKDIFVLRSQRKLEFFEFTQKYQIEPVSDGKLSIDLGPQIDDEKIFFGFFTGQNHQDVAILNSSGLLLYKFDQISSGFKFVSLDSSFSKAQGWTPQNSKTIFVSDFDENSTSDIIFTGVDGVSLKTFDLDSKTWKTAMAPNGNFEKILGISPKSGLLLQLPDGSLNFGELKKKTVTQKSVQKKMRISEEKENFGNSLSVFEIKKATKSSIFQRSDLRWTEQWSNIFEKNLLRNFPTSDGFVTMSMPLVDLSLAQYLKVQLVLSYSDQSQESNILGQGWNMPLLSNRIEVDYRCSVFDEDSIFTFYGMGSQMVMKRDIASEVEDSGVLRFKIAEKDDLSVFYHTGANSHWVIETPAEKFVYGRVGDSGATRVNLSWKDSRCGKSDVKNLKPIPVAWYVQERKDKIAGKSLFYQYNVVEKKISHGSPTYTHSLTLKSINYERKPIVSFFYEKKSADEISEINPISEGKVVFPIPLADDQFLAKVLLKTEKYSQTFSFTYKKIGDRSLHKIDQIFKDFSIENLLTMDYKKFDSGEVYMKNLILPRGTSIDLTHQKLARKIGREGLVQKFPVGENPTITPGANYRVIAFVRGNSIKLRINNDVDKDKLLEIPVDSSEFDYQIIAATKLMFLVLVLGEQKKEIVTVLKTESEWEITAERQNIDKSGKLSVGENFVALWNEKSEKIQILQWSSESDKLTSKILINPSNKPLIRAISQGRRIFAYDDENFVAFHLDSKDRWRTKNIKKIRGFEASTRDVINKFNIDADLRKELINSLSPNLMQIDSNHVVFTKLQISRGIISVAAHMMLISSDYKVAKEKNEIIQRENIFDIVHNEHQMETNFTMKYFESNGKFSIKIHDIISGNLHDELQKADPEQRNQEKSRILQEINESEDWKNYFQQIFPLEWQKYHARLTPQGLISDEITIEMTGDGWEKKKTLEEENSPTSLKIGPNLEIRQKDASVNELEFHDTKLKTSTLVHKAVIGGEFANFYPLYIAYQTNSSDINVISFTDEKTIGPVKVIPKAKLLQGRMDSTVIISENTGLDHSEPHEIQIRPLADLVPEASEYFVSEMIQTSDNLKRVTKFGRSYDIDEDGSLTEKIVITPGGDKDQFGWYEEMRSMNASKIITKERRTFHSDGRIKSQEIMEGEAKDFKKKEEEKEDFSQKLMGKNKILIISDINPLNLNDENFAYFGFEPYESEKIGDPESNNSWDFDRAKIVQNSFSLTGNNFLRLAEDGDIFEGSVTPSIQNKIFIASCWVRSSHQLQMNQEVDIFSAELTKKSTKPILIRASVKNQIEEWSYLEIFIDFKKIYESSPKNSLKFKINLKISNNDDSQIIDVDHVKFQPIDHKSWVQVFNEDKQLTEKILPNGTIKRNLYNRFKSETASIDENGNILSLKSSTLTGKLVNPSKSQRFPSQVTFTPSQNQIYDPKEFWKKWKIFGLESKNIWSFSPGQIHHESSQKHQIEVPGSLINMNSNVVRFNYAMTPSKSSFKILSKNKTILEVSRDPKLLISNRSFSVPPEGEIIFTMEDSRFIVWIDGVLLLDLNNSFEFSNKDSLVIEMVGQVSIDSFIHLNKPTIMIQYFNSWGELKQIINILNKNEVQVSETLYDQLGRRSITTKPTKITRTDDQTLAEFYSNFVTNDNYESRKSVWFTHHIEGDVNDLNPKCEGFPYKQTEFEKNPSGDKKVEALPGKEFSIVGDFSKKFESSVKDEPFLLNLFPASRGFTMKAFTKENGSKTISVNDSDGRKVAIYVKVPGFDHILSTYEYDKENRLVKILSPKYHEKVNTASKIDPWIFGDDHLNENEKKLQLIYGTHYAYDADGSLIKKSTPDNGVVEYVYDNNANRRFMKQADGQVVYFIYDDDEQLVETGVLAESPTVEELKILATSGNDFKEFTKIPTQEFGFSNHNPNPVMREAEKKFKTFNGNLEFSEEVIFDVNDKITERTTKFANEKPIKVERTYEMKKLVSMAYPKEENEDENLKLIYNYNKMGQLTSIGTPNDPTQFAEFTYTPDGLVESEIIEPKSRNEYFRNFEFQTAGYLSKISDPFLVEDLTYTSNGYGQKGFGDGVLTSTTFKALWTTKANQDLFKVKMNEFEGDQELLTRCVQALQQAGYISSLGVVEKPLNFRSEINLPLECKGKIGYQLSEKLGKSQIPKVYGHKYAYGNHQELTRAKYFSDETSKNQEPLKADSFSKESKAFKLNESRDIFKKLVNGNFLLSDQKNLDLNDALGLRGKEPLIRLSEIEEILRSLASSNFEPMEILPELESLLIQMIIKKKFSNETIFVSEFVTLYKLDTSSKWREQQLRNIAGKIFESLEEKNLIPTFSNPFGPINPKLFQSLRKYTRRMPEILKILKSHFLNDLGESPFDFHSYNIDANGNHRLFYNGFKRMEINYKGETNKVESLNFDDIASSNPKRNLEVDHDENGNVVKALHLDIESIEHYPTTQRPKKISMTDGRVLQFFYDAIGERIMKQVFGPKGNLEVSMRYVRDEKGNVLFEKRTVYGDKLRAPKEITTKYIYGPRGLIGFIRNGEFLSVATDHAGSIRLIVKNGRVVVSYDYLPYGDLMRKFVSNPEYEIPYRFTGQEFDDETGLYNFHARFYDPAIGRFFQIDPKAQYFSPYLYAGNSPISFVDPDGQWVQIFLSFVFGAVGAYLEAAAHNDSWNPFKWDWKDPLTYLSLGSGLACEYTQKKVFVSE